MWSRDVHIHDVAIVNGDDCITVKSGTSNVLAERITCRGSHGITVGSVWYDDVVNVTYRDVILTDCHAGPRIKGRSQGNATVRDILFKNIEVRGSVETVVQIDMLYETPGSTHPSAGVLARNCTFENVTTRIRWTQPTAAALLLVPSSRRRWSVVRNDRVTMGRLRFAACTREMQRVGGSAHTY